MTPAELNDAVDVLIGAVSALPVLIVVDGREYDLAQVEARTDGRLVLHVDNRGRHAR